MRPLKIPGIKAVTDAGLILSEADTRKLMKVLDMVNEACSKAEDNMFSDHPELSGEYTAVFYGASAESPVTRPALRIASIT